MRYCWVGFAEEDETRALKGANSEFGRALCDGTLELEVDVERLSRREDEFWETPDGWTPDDKTRWRNQHSERRGVPAMAPDSDFGSRFG